MSEQKTVARAIFFDQHNIMHDHDKHWRKADQGIWLSAADAALAAMNKREPITDSGWRPISEAPKDGTKLLLFGKIAYSERLSQYVGYWSTWDSAGGPVETWISAGPHFSPTHFRLLPPPPDGGPGK